MDLRHLKLKEERKLKPKIVELLAELDPYIVKNLNWSTVSDSLSRLRNLILLGQAFKTISEFRRLAPNIFILTNDELDSRSEPYDFGSLSNEIFEKYSWAPVHKGFGSEGTFENQLDFENFIIQINDKCIDDFVSLFLGGQLHPLQYWFCFAKKNVTIDNITKAVEAAENEDELKIFLCQKCMLISFGFEETCYYIITSDSSVVKSIKDSLSK